MPSQLKEKIANKSNQVKEKIAKHAKKFKPKLVLSKLRQEGPAGARRFVWLFVAFILYIRGWSINSIIQLYIELAVFLFIALPFVFKYTPWIQRHLVFLPFVKWPKNVDFNNPAAEGLPATRNFYLESEPGVSLGVWHILPQSAGERERTQEMFEEELGDDKTIILYLHGNSAHRAGPHRVELYHVLRAMDYHVVCCDYRGYADSTQVAPSETGVVTDARAVYDWVMARAGDSKVIVWGHSLGTGVASHLVADLCLEGSSPCGLVLESPFNNIFDEVRNHPMAWVWRKMPWFDWFFTNSLAKNDLGFVSDQRISVIDCPVLILHAEDDAVVPFKLGKALHDCALHTRSETCRAVQFKEFSGELGYAHKYICRAPELPEIVRDFEQRCCRDHD